MTTSVDPGHFFQTTSALSEIDRKAAKSKNVRGRPIKLRSKILACIADPRESGSGGGEGEGARIFAAEAGGIVELVDVEVKGNGTDDPKASPVLATFVGPTAPLSCLVASPTELFAGCWDKNIYVWPLPPPFHPAGPGSSSTTTIKPSRVLRNGHSDFPKALLLAPTPLHAPASTTDPSTSSTDAAPPATVSDLLLISAGADATIVIWDAVAGRKLQTLKGHARGVQTLTLDPVDTIAHRIVFWSGDSAREIRRWVVVPGPNGQGIKACEASVEGDGEEGEAGPFEPLLAHETSIYALRFDADGDMWTASADGEAKCLVRERVWECDGTVFGHPDFVMDVVVCERLGWVVTACRDEGVRIWDRSSGGGGGKGGAPWHVYDGHWEEVTGLVLFEDRGFVVSVSIDGTVRRWALSAEGVEEYKKQVEQESKDDQTAQPKTTGPVLTAEEEEELAALMADDD